MKRPKLQFLVIIGVLWLCLLKETNSLKATSLIFGKTTTTTTTTTTTEAPAADDENPKDDVENQNATVTKSPYTGIPQIDYLLDPNLPRELNGYNLTEYPFYASVPPPEEMDFKCDGLHDGFYASVPHKCQVYHHCLFGTRYDFLCANYTAFDQKTFICHFVSEVDCVNSPKYYHRNDALYQAASTTTVAPPTPLPTQAPVAPAVAAIAPRRPLLATRGGSGGVGSPRRRRPYRRRRPQYEYYDDDLDDYEDEFYDDEPIRGRRRNRPRPSNRRPDPDYEGYEDDYDPRFDRRGSYDDRRKPSEERRRPSESRRPSDDRDEDRRRPSDSRRSSDDRAVDEDRRRPYDRRPSDDRLPSDRRPSDDRLSGDRRPSDDRLSGDRRPSDDRLPSEDRKRPASDDRKYDRRRPSDSDRRKYFDDDDKDFEDRRPYDDRRRLSDDDDRRPYNRRKPNRRLPSDDRRSSADDRKTYDDNVYEREKPARRTDDDNRKYPSAPGDSEPKVTVKPASGSSIFSKPRAPPIIRRPVPLNEREKYDYTSTQIPQQSKKVAAKEEFYDDDEYVDDVETKYKERPGSSSSMRKYGNDRRSNQRPSESSSNKRRPLDLDDSYEYDVPSKPVSKKRPADELEHSFDDEPRSRNTQSYKHRSGPRSEIRDDSERSPSKIDDSDTEYNDKKLKSRRPAAIIDEPYQNDEPKSASSDDRSRFRQRTQIRNKPSYTTTTTSTTTTTTTTTVKPKLPVIPDDEYYYDDYDSEPLPKSTKKDNEKEYINEQNDDRETGRYVSSNVKDTSSKEETTVRVESVPKTYIKVVKRPFLPSRGGNPLAARGLLPVGSRALELSTTKRPNLSSPAYKTENKFSSEDDSESAKIDIRLQPDSDNGRNTEEEVRIVSLKNRDINRPGIDPDSVKLNLKGNFNVAGGRNFRTTGTNYQSENTETKINYKEPQNPPVQQPFRTKQTNVINPQVSSLQQNQNVYRSLPKPIDITTPDPRRIESESIRNPLDINENEYDVTLNDALNPTIPNLPKRHPPSGFILPRDQDYTWSRFQRPLINFEPLHQASSDVTYRVYEVSNPNFRINNQQPRGHITRLNGYVNHG